MKVRIIYTKFWADSFVLSLTTKERLFFCFLFTNDRVGIGYIYEIPHALLKLCTGLTDNEIFEAKKKLSENNKIHFYKDWVYLVNSKKYQQYTGKKNEIAKKRELNLISTEVKDHFKRYPINRVFPTQNSLNNQKPETRNQKPETRNQKKKNIKKKKKYSSLKDLEKKDLEEISDKYKVPLSFVKSKYDDLQNYCEAKGKNYKNYLAALRDFVKRDAIKLKMEERDKSKISFINPS